ncbi:MAG TPA: TVP38/TMEM64 family protein [Stellaceae bacterium]|jgi:uncharacterized membrane protein YdjX (TVP38/TMEM64 family)
MPASRRRSRNAKSDWREWAHWAGFGVVIAALCGGWLLLPLREWMDALQSWLQGFGAWGVVILVLILVFTTFLPAPDWPLPIAAGYVYGGWAFPLVYVSIVFASAVAFLAARHLGGDRIRALLDRRAKYRAFDKAVGEEGWTLVALVRLSPIMPFNLQNYAFAVTAIPFWPYLVGTVVGLIPGTALYVYFGIFGKGLGKGGNTLEWVLFGVGIVATIGLGVLVTVKTKAKFSEAEKSH